MRLFRLAAGCVAIAAMAGCSLAVQGLGAEDSAGDGAALDAQNTATVDGTQPPPFDATDPADDGAGMQGASDASAPPLDAGTPSLCAGSGLLFCDGFENGPSAWTPTTSGGSIAIESARAYRGGFALHARQPAVTAGVKPHVTAQFGHWSPQAWPLPTFVRMFINLQSPLPQSVGAFVDILESPSPYAGIQLNLRPPSGFLGGTAYNGLDSDWSSSSDILPSDSWTCVELGIEGPPANIVHVFVAGTELPAMQHTLPGDVPPLGILQVGLSYFQANVQPQTDLWIDEVAVDGARIGCDR